MRELTNERIKREKGINAKIAKKSEPFQTGYCATVFDKANLNADDAKGDKCTNFVASSEYCCCVPCNECINCKKQFHSLKRTSSKENISPSKKIKL